MRKVLVALLLILAAPAFAGEFVDADGRRVAVDDTSRVLALGGSVTEILYALGLEDRVAAVDATSYFPPRALSEKPSVGYLRQLSAEGVLSVSPSAILAEEDAGPPTTIALLEQASVPFLKVPGERSAEGVAAKIRFIGEVMGVAEKSDAMAAGFIADFAALDAALAGIAKPVRAMFILSLADGRMMAAGADTAADAMLHLAGAENALTGFERYKPVSTEAVIAAAPEAIVVMKRYGDGGPGIAVEDVLADPTLAETPAGKAKRVIAMNGLYLLGFGPRTAHAARDLAAALYPDLALPTLPARSWAQTPVGQ